MKNIRYGMIMKLHIAPLTLSGGFDSVRSMIRFLDVCGSRKLFASISRIQDLLRQSGWSTTGVLTESICKRFREKQAGSIKADGTPIIARCDLGDGMRRQPSPERPARRITRCINAGAKRNQAVMGG